MSTDRPSTLAERLRQDTRDLHAEAERSGAMADLLRGRLARERYVAMLRNLHAIYAALETAFDVQPPVLRRQAALAADLEALQGPQWREQVALAGAAAEYVERLAAQETPLLAHAYVRYLGDLHGGQLLQQRVAASLGGAATRFYDFGDAAAVRGLIAAFRERLVALPAAGAAADRLVAEARWAFGQHIVLFREI